MDMGEGERPLMPAGAGQPMKAVLVPADRPFLLAWMRDDYGLQISAPVGHVAAIGEAYKLLELSRLYVDEEARRLLGAQRQRIVEPGVNDG